MDESCLQFTENQLGIAKVGKITVASLAILICVVAIIIIFLHKAYKQFVYRLVLYLMVVDLIQSVTNILEGIPVQIQHSNETEHRNYTQVVVADGWGEACAAFAFGNQVTVWMENLMILWILFYLIVLVTKILKPQKFSTDHMTENASQPNFTQRELFALLFTIFFPFTFNWLPFLFKDGMYGLSGLWCWIKLTDKDCDGSLTVGLGLMFGLFYGPLILIIMFGLISFVVMAIVMCKRSRMKRGVDWADQKLYRRGLREVIPLLLYPLIYNLISTILVVNRITDAVRTSRGEKPIYTLWLLHSLADPGRVLIPPVAFILHPSTWKNLCCKKKESEASEGGTSFHVKPEFSDELVGSLRLTDRHNQQKRFSYGSIFMETEVKV